MTQEKMTLPLLLDVCLTLRHQYVDAQESASWYAWNQCVIACQNAHTLAEAHTTIQTALTNTHSQDAAEIYQWFLAEAKEA